MIFALFDWISGKKDKNGSEQKAPDKTANLSPTPDKTPDTKSKPTSYSIASDRKQDKLGSLLLRYNITTQENLQKALEIQANSKTGKFLGEIMIDEKMITEDDLVSVLSRQFRIPYIKISKYSIPREVLRLVPEDMVRRNLLLPINKMGKVLTVGMVNPQNTKAIDELKLLTGCEIKAIICKLTEIKDAIKTLYGEVAITTKIVLDPGEKIETPIPVVAKEINVLELTEAPESKPAPVKAESLSQPGSTGISVSELSFPKPPVNKPNEADKKITEQVKVAGITIEELAFPKPPEIKGQKSPKLSKQPVKVDAPIKEVQLPKPEEPAVAEVSTPVEEPTAELIPEVAAVEPEVVPEETEVVSEVVQQLEPELISEDAPAIVESEQIIEDVVPDNVEAVSEAAPETVNPEQEIVPESSAEAQVIQEEVSVIESEVSTSVEEVVAEAAPEHVTEPESEEVVVESVEASEPPNAVEPGLPDIPQEEEQLQVVESPVNANGESGITEVLEEEPVTAMGEIFPGSELIVMSDEQFAEAVRLMLGDDSGDLEQQFQRDKIVKAEVMPEEEFNFYRLL
ncbi:MAG: hypothetical protein WC980_00595 [Candidatus Brocadiia bacterium]